MGIETITLDEDCDFEGIHRCAIYSSVCQSCFERMEADGILATEAEAEAWIMEGETPARMKSNTEITNG